MELYAGNIHYDCVLIGDDMRDADSRKARRNVRSRSGENGFTLLETLLAVGLSAILTTFLVSAMQVWAESEKSEATKAYVESIANAVDDITENYEQFNAIFNHVELSGGVLQIGVLDSDGFPDSLQSGIWNGSLQVSSGSSRITDSYATTNPVKQKFSVVIAAIRSGPSGDERSLEILIASDGPLQEKDARDAAARMGANGGIVSVETVSAATECLSVGCNRTARGIFNDWKTDLSLYSGTAWEGTVSANPPSSLNGAYLVFHRYLMAQEVAGDYLYRVPVDGSPEVNQMHTDLDLSGNSLVGVDNVRVSDLGVADYISARGSASIGGEFSTPQMVVNGTTRAGSIQIAKTHDTTDPRIDEYYGGRITNTVSVDGSVSASSASVSSLTAGSVNAGSLATPTLTAGSVSNNGSLSAVTLTADTVNSGISDADIYEYYGSSGVFPLPSGNFVLQDLTVGQGYVKTLDAGNLSGTVTSSWTSIGTLTGCSGC